ncbi:MAG: histidine kinase dimerization/phosphoacceptor domain -containing protein [Rudaea sp.]
MADTKNSVPTDSGPRDPTGTLVYLHQQQQLLAEFGMFAIKTRDTSALLQEATRVCAVGLGRQFCKVLEYQFATDDFLVCAGVGWRPGVVGHARLGGHNDSPAGYAFDTRLPVVSNELATEVRFRTPPLLIEHGVHRAVNVLIEGDEGRFGVLEADSKDGDAFDGPDVAFLQSFANLLGVAIERQRAADRSAADKLSLQQALQHQELLTQEIGHRVKNSLALIAAVLTMQRMASKSPELAHALSEAEARVQTIAKVHDGLSRHNEVREVRLDRFMGELCQGFSAASPNHTLTCNVAPITVATDKAIAIGMLANELIFNAFKYAYPSGHGDVSISIQPTASGELRLEVSDAGVGFEPVAASEKNSLGMKIVSSLCRQLRGTAHFDRGEKGTHYILTFAP